MKNLTLLASVLLLNPLYAVTTFTNAVDTNANNVGNWSSGDLPGVTDPDALIQAGATATTSANFGTNNIGFNLDISGTFNISSGHTLNLGDGNSSLSGADLTVLNNGILNISGTALVFGGGAHTYIETGGTINVLSGGLLDERKNLIMSGGTIKYATGSLGNNSTGFSLTGTDRSTISFDIASNVYTTAIFDTAANLDSAGGINLFADMTGAMAGDQYTIFTANGISGTFDDFSYTIDSGLEANVTYDATNAYINVTTIPEPSSTALLGLSGLALILRRRR